MKFGLLSVAVKNLKRKPFRTAVLVFSIGLLVSILVFGASFIQSVSASIKRASDRLGADVLVVPIGARESAEEVLLETKAKTFYMDSSLIERVRAVEGVGEMTAQTYLTTILAVCCDIPPAKVVAFNQDTDFIINPWLKKSINRRLKKNEAIIGFDAFDNFGLLDVEESKILGANFKIAGVLEKTGTGLDNAILMGEENIAEIMEKGNFPVDIHDKISLIFVKTKDGYDPVSVSRKIEGEIIEVDTVERSDMGQSIVGTLKDINRVFVITMVLSTVLTVMLTWTIFSAIINERTREVGIMRAIGARESHVMRVFVLEVLVLGLMGSAAGIVIGTYLSVYLSGIFDLLRNTAATLLVSERVGIALFGLVAGIGICLAGALSPVLRVKRLEPLLAIKEA